MKKTANLTITHPNLAKEWHPTKNGNLLPTMVSKGSEKKVWWLGACNHEWVAAIGNRVYFNAGCPYCSNKKILQGFNDLATTNPELAKEWHPTKNGDLLPTMVSKGQSKKVWWLGACGHEWETRINNRSTGNDCPYCSNHKVLQGLNDLATTNPELAKEWHPTKNGDLLPTMVSKGQKLKVWWLGACGHEWETRINNRLQHGTGCPYCCSATKKLLQGFNDLATTNPELAKEWHPTKNGDLQPTMVSKGQIKKVWWLGVCGHEWQTTIESRSAGNGCPYCSNHKVLQGYNDLVTTNPKLAKEWHPTKNGNTLPTMVSKGQNRKVWWLGACGHEWKADISNRVYMGIGCPYCSNRKTLQGFNDLATTNPELAKEWHPTKNSKLLPILVNKGSNQKVWWLGECGHEWKATINNRSHGSGCPYCKKCIPSKSKAHKYVLDMLETCNIEYIPEFRHTSLKMYPYDVYLPTKNCLIEIDGGFHFKFSNIESLKKRKKIDDKKTEFAITHNIPLLRIPTSIYDKNPEKFRYYINEFIDKKTIHQDIITEIQIEEQSNPYDNLYLETLLK